MSKQKIDKRLMNHPWGLTKGVEGLWWVTTKKPSTGEVVSAFSVVHARATHAIVVNEHGSGLVVKDPTGFKHALHIKDFVWEGAADVFEEKRCGSGALNQKPVASASCLLPMFGVRACLFTFLRFVSVYHFCAATCCHGMHCSLFFLF